MAESNMNAQALVRRMRDDDAEAVAQLLRAAYGTPDAGAISVVGLASLPLTASRVRRWHQASAATWIAEVPGFGPVGAVFAVAEPGAAWMAGLGVAPSFRGAGVGAALTDHALEFLAASGRTVTGMDAASTAVGALGLYARRGFRPADLTVRLRGAAAQLASNLDRRGWREITGPDLSLPDHSGGAEAETGVHAHPCSAASYLLEGPGVTLLCDPDPLIPADGGSLDLRLVSASARHDRDVSTLVGVAAHSAWLRGLAALDVDLALADGVVLGRLRRMGLAPIASTIRLVSDLEAYVDWRRRNGPIGRWSF
ncbi:MAG: GNAT family N-acetyltransferase [Chloroflexi bacterium]|nr:GNAT family N-acetyltransferase [Chloroflexota bacterium]